MRTLPLALAVALALPLAGPLFGLGTTEAKACSTASAGVSFIYVQAERRPIPPDSVIPIAVHANKVVLAEEAPYITAVLVDGEGIKTPLELTAIDLSPPPVAGVERRRPGLVILRPDSDLAPDSAYSLQITHAESPGYPADYFEVTIETSSELSSAPTMTPSASIGARHRVVEERTCCETDNSSCGDSYICDTTRIRLTPSARIEAAIPLADQPYGLPWVARQGGDGEGKFTERHYPSISQPLFYEEVEEREEREMWTTATGNFPLVAKSGTHCFVSGVTDLRSFQEKTSESFCVDTDVETLPEDKVHEYEPSAGLGIIQCVGPWITEEVGTGVEGGCAVGGHGAPAGLFLLFLARLRRRS